MHVHNITVMGPCIDGWRRPRAAPRRRPPCGESPWRSNRPARSPAATPLRGCRHPLLDAHRERCLFLERVGGAAGLAAVAGAVGCGGGRLARRRLEARRMDGASNAAAATYPAPENRNDGPGAFTLTVRPQQNVTGFGVLTARNGCEAEWMLGSHAIQER